MMTQPNKLSCIFTCWAVAAAFGVVATVVARVMIEISWPGSVFCGILVAAVLGLLLSTLLCGGSTAPRYVQKAAAAPVLTATAAPAAAAPVATPAPMMSAAADPVAQAAPDAPSVSTSVPAPMVSAPTVSAPTVSAEPEVAAPAAVAAPIKAAPVKAPAAKAAPEKAAKPVAKPAVKAAATPTAKTAPAPVVAAVVDDAAVAAAGAGSKPKGLKAPRKGQADDLKTIEGIGPVLERLCHDMGIYHFDQIAAWGPAEVAWMNANLKGFKGRVGRDKWVAQARLIGEVGVDAFLIRAKTNDY